MNGLKDIYTIHTPFHLIVAISMVKYRNNESIFYLSDSYNWSRYNLSSLKNIKLTFFKEPQNTNKKIIFWFLLLFKKRIKLNFEYNLIGFNDQTLLFNLLSRNATNIIVHREGIREEVWKGNFLKVRQYINTLLDVYVLLPDGRDKRIKEFYSFKKPINPELLIKYRHFNWKEFIEKTSLTKIFNKNLQNLSSDSAYILIALQPLRIDKILDDENYIKWLNNILIKFNNQNIIIKFHPRDAFNKKFLESIDKGSNRLKILDGYIPWEVYEILFSPKIIKKISYRKSSAFS